MNKERRAEIKEILELLDKVTADLEEIQNSIENIKDEEQEYLDNIPENLQGSDKYTKAEEAVENLETAYDSLGEAIEEQIYEARTSLENAME